MKNNNKTIVVTGDFNYDILKYEYNSIINNCMFLSCHVRVSE